MKTKYWYGLLMDGKLIHVVDWDEPNKNDEVLEYLGGDLGLPEGYEDTVIPVRVEPIQSHDNPRLFCSYSLMDMGVDNKRYSFVAGGRYTLVSVDDKTATLINKFDSLSKLDLEIFNKHFRELKPKDGPDAIWESN